MNTNTVEELEQLRNELDYAYGVIAYGFKYSSFDFSVLRKRAEAWVANKPEDAPWL